MNVQKEMLDKTTPVGSRIKGEFMCKKTFFSITILVFLCASLSATLPKRQDFMIANYSSKILFLYIEFWTVPVESSWQQACFNNVDVSVFSSYYDFNEVTLSPRLPLRKYTNGYSIIAYYPFYFMGGDIFLEKYDELGEVPMVDILKTVFKTFSIGTKENPNMFTLENIEDMIIRNDRYSTLTHVLEIFDDDIF